MSNPSPRSILLVGCGNMGSAMLSGWLKNLSNLDITVIDPSPIVPLIPPPPSITVRYKTNFDSVAQDINSIYISILSTKPQSFSEIAPQLANHINKDGIILSIMAGISIDKILKSLNKNDLNIVRAMPNTPAMIGQGITACFSTSHNQNDTINDLLSPLGDVIWLEKEADMNAVTALSGSGPAYLFHLIESMANSGVELGLSPEVSMKLARKTVIGASLLAQSKENEPIQTLRQNVTSKGGTTEASLNILMDPQTGLKPLIQKAMEAAAKRSRELSSL